EWYANLSDALAACRPDGVIIATPNQLHVENALEAVAAGIPVLVEKPIAHSSQAAVALVSAGLEKDVPILVGHHRRHNPLVQAAKRFLDDDRIGTIRTLQGTFWVAKPEDYFAMEWRRRPGAGPIFINLIHDIDLFRHLIGEIEGVHAMESNAARRYAVEDTAVVLLRFASGALGTLNASDAVASPWSWETTSAENPAFPRHDQPCYLIGGTKGSLSIPQLSAWTNGPAPTWLEPLAETRLQYASGDPLELQLRHFCDVIARKAPPLVSAEEGLASLRITEAIKTSAATGKTVHLPPNEQRGF
ncbi:MAG: Gfo/Idh/MocA family oxidoreductase, partial [Rhizobiaceae bacterium]|nr:Gfo/Idh/MocA family oxidoreductase [Rhizobiaceae bacterium]